MLPALQRQPFKAMQRASARQNLCRNLESQFCLPCRRPQLADLWVSFRNSEAGSMWVALCLARVEAQVSAAQPGQPVRLYCRQGGTFSNKKSESLPGISRVTAWRRR